MQGSTGRCRGLQADAGCLQAAAGGLQAGTGGLQTDTGVYRLIKPDIHNIDDAHFIQ